MLIDLLITATFLGFTYMAWDDYKKCSVSSKLTALLWVIWAITLSLQGNISGLFIVVFSFGIIYLINELFYSKFKNPLVAWGDVLLLPLFFSFMAMFDVVLPFAFAMLGMLICQTIFSYWKYGKEVVNVKIPLIAYIYVPFVIALLYRSLATCNC